MTDWTYGKEGERFPTAPGQVWRVSDRHTYVCSDFMETTLIDEVIDEIGPIDLLYTDPPWGQGLVNGFRTKAGKGRAAYTWQDLYRRVAKFGHDAMVPVWVEGSVETHRDGAEIPFTILAESHPHRGYVEVVYGQKRAPSGLYYAGTTPADLDLLERMRGVLDDDLPEIIMRDLAPTGLVLDMCGGRGMTSRKAEAAGWRSVSNEMNVHRLSAALSRMSELTGCEPEQIR